MLNILVIGTGMYSTGRGTNAYGTILPAIVEWKRDTNNLGKLIFVGSNGNNYHDLINKSNKLTDDTGVSVDITFLPEFGTKDSMAYRKVINEIPKPACAIIVVPDHLHFQVAEDCLNADLPFLIVKPLTPGLEEARKLVNLSEERSLYSSVEFHKRFDKANLIIKDNYQSGKLGELLYCWVEYSQRKSIPTEVFKDWVEQTSILQYLGVHYIDIVRFITNAVPVRVMAHGQKNWLSSKGVDVHDSIQCFIEWKCPNGNLFTQTILTNWIDPESSSAMSDQKIKLVGTKGRLESNQKDRGITINSDINGIEQPNPDFCYEFGSNPGNKEWRGYGIDSVKIFLNDIVKLNSGLTTRKALQNNRPILAEALISSAVIDAAHESLASKNLWVKVEL